MWLEGREGGRMVLFTIHPFLFYIVPKKNKRTNTFLNKGRALEVEAHWGARGGSVVGYNRAKPRTPNSSRTPLTPP